MGINSSKQVSIRTRRAPRIISFLYGPAYFKSRFMSFNFGHTPHILSFAHKKRISFSWLLYPCLKIPSIGEITKIVPQITANYALQILPRCPHKYKKPPAYSTFATINHRLFNQKQISSYRLHSKPSQRLRRLRSSFQLPMHLPSHQHKTHHLHCNGDRPGGRIGNKQGI